MRAVGMAVVVAALASGCVQLPVREQPDASGVDVSASIGDVATSDVSVEGNDATADVVDAGTDAFDDTAIVVDADASVLPPRDVVIVDVVVPSGTVVARGSFGTTVFNANGLTLRGGFNADRFCVGSASSSICATGSFVP